MVILFSIYNCHDIILRREVDHMYRFLPDIYQKSIYAINYENLKNAGIKIILFDLDNTIASLSSEVPSKKVRELFEDIKEMGMKPIILSNSPKKRVSPFKEELVVDASYFSFKPFKHKYKKIMKIYGVKASEVAAIGDQLMTDIYGANRMGLTSILINPISKIDPFNTKINRMFENMIIKHFTKRSVFERGKYYE